MELDFDIVLGILVAASFVQCLVMLILMFDMRKRNGILYKAVLFLIQHLANAAEWNAKHSARRNMRRILKKFLKEKGVEK